VQPNPRCTEIVSAMTMHHRSCWKVRWTAAPALLICTLLAASLVPSQARAQFTGKVDATGQFESNSNVFDLARGLSPPGSNGRRSDTDFAYGADVDLRYLWGRQVIYATAYTKEYDYQHFSELNHNDYSIDTGLDWKLGSLLDGKVEAVRTHTMVPFSDLTNSALELSVLTEQRESAQVGIKLNSVWKVILSGYTSKDDEPIAQAPELQLTQNSGTASIQYSGVGPLTSGLTATYLSGDFAGTNGTVNPSFSQTTGGLLANYKVKRMTFDGQIGYSHRNSTTGTDNTSGLTGLFDLKYQLTPKTSFTVKIDRQINSYLVNSGSEIDTDAGATIDWQATYKLGVSVGYTFSYRFFPAQGNDPVGSDRTDIQELATLSATYQPQRWLQIRPYANVTTRRSTFIGGHFSQNVIGVSVVVTPYKTKGY
jgi:hypothetical protein